MLSKIRGMAETLRLSGGTCACAVVASRVAISRQTPLVGKFTTLPLSPKNDTRSGETHACWLWVQAVDLAANSGAEEAAAGMSAPHTA